MFFNYSLKLRHRQLELDKSEALADTRIKVLEKKNGSEQRQINELKKEIEKLKGDKHE